MTQYRLFLAGFIAFAVAIGTASAEPINIGKLHALLWNQEAEAMARYGTDGDEIPEVRVADPTVTTERAEDGTILAVVKAQFFTGGRIRRIRPDVYFTDLYCVMEDGLEAARRIRADQQLIFIGPIASVETYDEKTSNSWFSTKRAVIYPCSIVNESEPSASTNLSGGSTPTELDEHHCSRDETVAFSCRAGKKLVSVCLSSDFANGTGSLQYRFGPLGGPEMTLPDVATSRQGVTAGTIAYSGGGADYIRFAHGDTRYIVYSGAGRGWVKEGVAVEQKGKLLANLPCKENSTGTLTPHGGGTLSVPGLPEDTEGFEIPE